jgi:hypothetical protein
MKLPILILHVGFQVLRKNLAGYEEKMYPEDGRTSEPEQLTKLP